MFVSTEPSATPIPPLLTGLVDDAAVFPPGSAPLPAAVAAHRGHRAAWYRDLVGPLLVPVSAFGAAAALLGVDGRLTVGAIGDTGLDRLPEGLAGADPRLSVRQVEAPVARRGEDPQPGLRRLVALLRDWPQVLGYAEIPLSWGLLGALDTVAQARADGLPLAAKFRTGGLAAELFPTPRELATVICACRDRELPFKLTAGLHHALRHTDPATGFPHHGFLNVLVAAAAAAEGAGVGEVADRLAATDAEALVAAAAGRLDRPRPLWVGYGSCSVEEPLTDLVRLELVKQGGAA